jgi:TetR/AcrR family transcriptional regulator
MVADKNSDDTLNPSTRDRILAAALAEFAARGLDGARVHEIARRASINKQALYYYFGSKDRLFQAALAFGYAQGLPDSALGDDVALAPAESMRRLIGIIFDHFRHTPYIGEMIAHENRYHGEHLSPDVRKEISDAVAPVQKAITAVLQRGQRQEVFSKRVDAIQFYLTVVATCMFYFGNAYTLSAIVGQDLLDEKLVARRRRHVQDFLVAGLLNQPVG